MAILDDLVNQITDEALKERIKKEISKQNKQKKFGLVFEEHLPESTPLYDLPIKVGSNVALKGQKITQSYIVAGIKDDKAVCFVKGNPEDVSEFNVSDLVCIAEFGEPIYPYLKPIDSICNASDSDLWHTLIEADNYHALQLLEYLYAGKVDCIYIDPPYNTGAKDWKYNNDYVDSNDAYRHSKWLSMMEKRLKIAKKLLNPADSVLIVTIDEKEYLHLGCLLEEMFPEAIIQMVSSIISPQGNQRKNQFSRHDEYLYFVQLGESAVQKLPLSDEWRMNASDQRTTHLHWQQLIRNGDNGTRKRSPGCFYPILVSQDGKHFAGVGKPLDINEKKEDYIPPCDTLAMFPMHKNGVEGCWGCSPSTLIELQRKGYVKLGKLKDGNVPIMFLQKGMIEKVEKGFFEISGYNEDGSIISDNEYRSFIPATQWRIASHDASRFGNALIAEILGEKRFSFPKSLYAVHDTVRFFVANKPNALIVDFFAGSGTTLHAVNLLNAEDSGKRRCILVTNNEVSEAEKKDFEVRGIHPGDEEWETKGIARYVTWPRTVCSIKGENIKGEPLNGSYIGSDIPMSDGFKTNANFFKLGFLDKTSISLGRQFRELLPVIWMKAGANGKCPEIDGELPKMLILPENKFAVLIKETCYASFAKQLEQHPEIRTVFFVTDSEDAYHSMANGINVKETYQLYRDYLDNFRINTGRN